MLEFRSISVTLGGRAVLRGIDLRVSEGETVVLLGRSGSGKTTLLRTANGLVRADAGEVRFEGRALRDWDLIRLRRRMGYVIQDAGLFPHRTVEENVGLVPRLEGEGGERVRERVREVLGTVGLDPDEFGPRYPRSLSGGQKQRVGIARALAADPPMLLLDEPFAALDPVTRFELQQEFLTLRKTMRKTALFVTHDLREALLVGTRIVLLREGSIDLSATPDEFMQAETPEARAFLASHGR